MRRLVRDFQGAALPAATRLPAAWTRPIPKACGPTATSQRHRTEERMTDEELRAVEVRFQQVSREREQVRAERNGCVAQALAEGWTHARIADAMGMTRGRVGQLAMKREARR